MPASGPLRPPVPAPTDSEGPQETRRGPGQVARIAPRSAARRHGHHRDDPAGAVEQEEPAHGGDDRQGPADHGARRPRVPGHQGALLPPVGRHPAPAPPLGAAARPRERQAPPHDRGGAVHRQGHRPHRDALRRRARAARGLGGGRPHRHPAVGVAPALQRQRRPTPPATSRSRTRSRSSSWASTRSSATPTPPTTSDQRQAGPSRGGVLGHSHTRRPHLDDALAAVPSQRSAAVRSPSASSAFLLAWESSPGSRRRASRSSASIGSSSSPAPR